MITSFKNQDNRAKRLSKELSKIISFSINNKSESFIIKIISKILFFNKEFSKYITTIGSKVYVPDQWMDRHELETLPVICHEFRHLYDAKNDKLFGIKYLMPQILAPLMLLFCFLNLYLGIGLFILFLLPLPAYYRMKFELYGYSMALFTSNELYLERKFSEKERFIRLTKLAKSMNDEQFVGSAYYFMWIFGVNKNFNKIIDEIISGDIKKTNDIYEVVSRALKASKY